MQERVILIDVISPDTTPLQAEKRLEELESLTKTYGGLVVLKTIQKKALPSYETYIGKGKLQEILEIAKEKKGSAIIINNLLKPRQLFRLEELAREAGLKDLKVWDRVDLILKIFAKHAKTQEAKLQIELASIRHMGPRIYGMGEELMRQAGATGVRAGQGESNIELMKRHLRKQELKIKEKLEKYEKIHATQRKTRQRRNFKTVALVGYTNAGKSSLMNALTGKDAYVADELFATLSTRTGKLFIPGSDKIIEGKYVRGKEMLISDTIGFIQDLPPKLIQAFKSTLTETINADLLLHVIDATDDQIHQKIQVVEDILAQLGLAEKPKIYVFNKIDLIKSDPIVEEVKEGLHRPPSLLKAGSEAMKELGWAMKDDEEEGKLIRTKTSLKKLIKQYEEFTPVCISAYRKMKLEDLIAEIVGAG